MEMYENNPIFKRIVTMKRSSECPPGTPFVVKDGSSRDIQCDNTFFNLNPVSKGEMEAAKKAVAKFQSGGTHPQPLGAEFNCWADDAYYEEEEGEGSKPANAKQRGLCSSSAHSSKLCPYKGKTTIAAHSEYKCPAQLKPKSMSKKQLGQHLAKDDWILGNTAKGGSDRGAKYVLGQLRDGRKKLAKSGDGGHRYNFISSRRNGHAGSSRFSMDEEYSKPEAHPGSPGYPGYPGYPG